MTKIIKEPLKVRILSLSQSHPDGNREQRRAFKRMRASSPLCTKRWTRGRLKPRINQLKLVMHKTKGPRGMMYQLLNAFKKKIGMAK